MRPRWYDWVLLVVVDIPVGIGIALRDRLDAWRYRH